MATFRCPHCGGTDVETRAWVKYKNDQFVFSDFCEEGWTCWECELEDIDVVVEGA